MAPGLGRPRAEMSIDHPFDSYMAVGMPSNGACTAIAPAVGLSSRPQPRLPRGLTAKADVTLARRVSIDLTIGRSVTGSGKLWTDSTQAAHMPEENPPGRGVESVLPAAFGNMA